MQTDKISEYAFQACEKRNKILSFPNLDSVWGTFSVKVTEQTCLSLLCESLPPL